MSIKSSADILKNGESYYSLVIAASKRAREIAEDAEINKSILTEKAVITALNEIDAGEYKIIENEGIKGKFDE